MKKKRLGLRGDSVGWSLLGGVVETHAFLTVLDQTHSGKEEILFFLVLFMYFIARTLIAVITTAGLIKI